MSVNFFYLFQTLRIVFEAILIFLFDLELHLTSLIPSEMLIRYGCFNSF